MMAALTLSEIAAETGGQLVGDAPFGQLCTDTRKLQSGDLFLALTGDNFDGNKFVGSAVKKGAVAAVVSQRPSVDVPHLLVEDTRLALGLIARINRRRFKKPLIGLTGSAGKTSCKEMLAAILGECGNTLATEDNLNNEIGVPQTLLRLCPEHQFAVVEMGASRSGDIRYLCQFSEPDIAVLTNAMSAHIEGFGDLDTVAETKGEIFEILPENGVAIINLDDVYAERWKQQASGREQLTFSVENEVADVYAKDIQFKRGKGVVFTLCCRRGEVIISLQLLGRHNISNALAAAAAALAVNVNLENIQQGLEKVEAVPGRLKIQRGRRQGLSVIDDSYNANPGSVKAAIDVLVQCGNDTCLVLGTMGELGEQAESLHREMGVYARKAGVKQLLAVGEWADVVAKAFANNAQSFSDCQQLLDGIEQVCNAQVVLVKGSRSARMERVVEHLMVSSGEKQ